MAAKNNLRSGGVHIYTVYVLSFECVGSDSTDLVIFTLSHPLEAFHQASVICHSVHCYERTQRVGSHSVVMDTLTSSTCHVVN